MNTIDEKICFKIRYIFKENPNPETYMDGDIHVTECLPPPPLPKGFVSYSESKPQFLYYYKYHLMIGVGSLLFGIVIGYFFA